MARVLVPISTLKLPKPAPQILNPIPDINILIHIFIPALTIASITLIHPWKFFAGVPKKFPLSTEFIVQPLANIFVSIFEYKFAMAWNFVLVPKPWIDRPVFIFHDAVLVFAAALEGALVKFEH